MIVDWVMLWITNITPCRFEILILSLSLEDLYIVHRLTKINPSLKSGFNSRSGPNIVDEMVIQQVSFSHTFIEVSMRPDLSAFVYSSLKSWNLAFVPDLPDK